MRYKSPLWSAVQKYGIDHFTFILLEECEPIKQSLEALEQHYIDLLKPEYNTLPKAYSGIGNKSRSGQKNSEASKEAHRQYQKTKMADPENRAKISRALKGVKKTYDVFTKGKPRTEEDKRKISEGNLRSEKRKAHSESRRGKPTSCSRSGEYGIRWRPSISKWTVIIDGKHYGAYLDIADAVARRDYILALDPQDRRPNRTGTSKSISGEYGVIWRKDQQKWLVRLGKRTYGQFASIEEAIVKRDLVMT